MKNKFARNSVISINKNIIKPNLIDDKKKKLQRNSLKFNIINKGEVLFHIQSKLKQTFLKKEKDFEKKAGNIIKKNKYNYSNQAQNNYYIMFIRNINSEKSHRIRLKYSEIIFEVDPHEQLIKYYKRYECYTKLGLITKAYGNNIIFFPNYFVNEKIYPIMIYYLEVKEELLNRTEKYNKYSKLDLPLLKKKRINRYKEISNKIIETFNENNSLNLEDNLKNLNDESSSKTSTSKSYSSIKVKKLICDLNNNLEKKNDNKRNFNKKIMKLKTKNLDEKNIKNNDNNLFKIKRMKSETKPISFNQNKIIQKMNLDNYLNNRLYFLRNEIKDKRTMKNNKIQDNNIYLKTFTEQQKKNMNQININRYNFKNKEHDKKFLHNFKSTDLFIYNLFKEWNLEKQKSIKYSIINSIKEFEIREKLKIISCLKAKEKTLIKKFNLSSSKKLLKKNYVQRDGFSTEITKIKDIFKRQKLQEKRALNLKGKSSKDYSKTAILFYNKINSNYYNSESMAERIKLNIRSLLKNKKYVNLFSLIEDNF